MATALVTAALVIAFAALVQASRYVPIGFASSFLALHIIFVGSNFFFAALYVDNLFNIYKILDYSYIQRARLAIGDGLRPGAYLLAIYGCVFLGIIAGKKLFVKAAAPIQPKYHGAEIKAYAYLAFGVIGGAVVYKLISLHYLSAPLLAYLKDPWLNPASIALLIDSDELRLRVPYLMLPPIDRQITMVILTAGVLMLVRTMAMVPGHSLIIMSIVAVGLVLVMNLSYLKRTPLLIITLWFFLAWLTERNTGPRHTARFLKYACIAALASSFVISLLYQPTVKAALAPPPVSANETKAVSRAKPGGFIASSVRDTKSYTYGLLARVLAGESLEKFYAVEHWGTTIDYAGTEFIKRYFISMTGVPQETIGEYWYRQLHPDAEFSGNISTSQDIFLEAFIYFGPVAACITAFLAGLLLIFFDSLRFSINMAFYMPFYTGFMLLVAIMSVKGFMSVFFASGGFSLLLLTGAAILLTSLRNPVGRFYVTTARCLPKL